MIFCFEEIFKSNPKVKLMGFFPFQIREFAYGKPFANTSLKRKWSPI
jgi:hypothetical protein